MKIKLGIAVILLLVPVIIGASVYYWQQTLTIPNVSLTSPCDVSGLVHLPSLPANLNWTTVTPTDLVKFEQPVNSKNLSGISFSSTTGKLLGKGAFYLLPYSSSSDSYPLITGKAWFSLEDELSFGTSYGQILEQQGWSREINVAGHKIMATLSGGYHGETQGWVKMQNGYFRAASLHGLFVEKGLPRYTIIFVSDIAPISQVIPDFESQCSEYTISSSSVASSISPFVQFRVNQPNGIIMADSFGRRVGRDSVIGEVYDEISGARYQADRGSVGIIYPNPPKDLYTISITGSTLYGLQTWVLDGKNPSPNQNFSGNFDKGKIVTYLLDYNPENIASSTIVPRPE